MESKINVATECESGQSAYMQTKNSDTINSQNINDESFYNCCQLAKITRYADPIAAFKATGEAWSVSRDAYGNILTATKI